jgi:hypothetical protein
MNLKDLSKNELKALAYDQLKQLEICREALRLIDEEIRLRPDNPAPNTENPKMA